VIVQVASEPRRGILQSREIQRERRMASAPKERWAA